MKIMLDAGHAGKYNQSPCNKTYYESEMAWKLQSFLKAELESYGVTVLTTRTALANDLSLAERGSSAKGCDLFISLHSNAVGSGVNEDVDYPVVFVPLNGSATTLGNNIAVGIQNLMETKQKGYAKSQAGTGGTDYLGVIRAAVAVNVPAILIEHSFHTNTRATNWLLSDINLKLMAKKEADLIAAHYNLKKVVTPTMATPIIGKQTISAYELSEYLLKNNSAPKINCTALALAEYFIAEGAKLGVRGDIAFCQSIHETGWFKYGGQVLPEQNNFAGIGATNNSAVGKGAWFETPEIGVRAQIQHLFAYASKAALSDPCVDPRFTLVTRGIAPNWEDLNGRWAVPGPTYGQTILQGFEALSVFAKNLPKPVIPVAPVEPKGTGDNPSSWAKEATIWAKDVKLFSGDGNGNYDWQAPLTREQAAQLFYNMNKLASK